MLEVLRFTFIQNTKQKAYRITTMILPLIIAGVAIMGTLIFAMKSSNSSQNTIQTVYVNNQTDLNFFTFEYFNRMIEDESYPYEFIIDTKVPKNNLHSLEVTIEKIGEKYEIHATTPEDSEIKSQEVKALVSNLEKYVSFLYSANRLIEEDPSYDIEEIVRVLSPVPIVYLTEGDENVAMGAAIFEMIAPMLIVLVLYMMALLYGQSVSKVVISEKVSKLMETLLMMTTPYKLVIGKVLGMAATAIVQIFSWILGIVFGIIIGDWIASAWYPGYSNIVIEIIRLMDILSVPAVILSILVLILSFLFYCCFAALIASTVSKAEELSSAFGIYQVAVVIGFLVAYMVPVVMTEESVLGTVLRCIPFTATFMLPGDIIIGRIAPLQAVGYVGILTIVTMGVIIYTGRLYKSQVFYQNSNKSPLKRLLSR